MIGSQIWSEGTWTLLRLTSQNLEKTQNLVEVGEMVKFFLPYSWSVADTSYTFMATTVLSEYCNKMWPRSRWIRTTIKLSRVGVGPNLLYRNKIRKWRKLLIGSTQQMFKVLKEKTIACHKEMLNTRNRKTYNRIVTT